MMCDGALPSLGWLNICLLMGSSEGTSYFTLFVCVAFALSVKLFQPMSFCSSALTVLSSTPLEDSERVAV